MGADRLVNAPKVVWMSVRESLRAQAYYIEPVPPYNPRPLIPWSVAPLLLPTVGFAVGIAAAAGVDFDYGWVFGLVSVGLALAGLTLHLRPRPDGLTGRAAGIALLLALTALGAWYATVRHPLNDARHFSRMATDGLLEAEVSSVKAGKKRTAVELDVVAVVDDSLRRATTGRLLAYLPPGALAVGDRVLLAADVDTLAAPLNPEVFDYAAYLASQNIFHRSFVDSGQWVVLGRHEGFTLREIGERSRATWFASLQPYLAGDDLAVAAALIMGKRDLLGGELRSAYADTGAIHVLAVSGLHVGILALIVLQLMTFLLPPRRWANILRTVVTVGVVWYFALITGLPASVQRAAVMVTVVLLGKQLNRNNSVFNLLAIAALLMLVVEPKQLFQVGFQLSFAAVAGIALFARRIQRLLYLPGKLHLLWDAISVSTAAQLGTLPLSLYYFGQFPMYFMLSGTLVIVFAYVVLGLGLLHGFLAAVGVSGAGLLPTGTLLYWTVSLQNGFIFYCRKLPGATLQISDFGVLSVIGLYVIIGALAYLTFRPSHRGRWVLMGAVGAVACYWLLRPALAPPPAQFVVYHIPYNTLIDVYDGRSALAIGDTIDEEQLGYNVTPLRRTLGADFGDPIALTRDISGNAAAIQYPLLRLLDRTVLVLDRESNYIEVPEVDLVLIRSGLRPDGVGVPVGATLVVDGSNAPYIGRMWKEAYPAAWVTGVDGAYRFIDTR